MERPTGAPTSRRTVLKGAAWSVPVVAASTAVAPTASASTGGGTGQLVLSAGCLLGVGGIEVASGFRMENVGGRPYTHHRAQPEHGLSQRRWHLLCGPGADVHDGRAPRQRPPLLPGCGRDPDLGLQQPRVGAGRAPPGSGSSGPFSITITRTLSLAPLPAGGATGIGYVARVGLALGDFDSTITDGNSSATLDNSILTLTCA